MRYLERHNYAPELNKLWWNGKCVPLPGVKSLAEARARFRAQPFALLAEVRSEYPSPWTDLNRVYVGKVPSRDAALVARRKIQQQSQGGKLFDGRTLPPARVTCRTWFVGT